VLTSPEEGHHSRRSVMNALRKKLIEHGIDPGGIGG
jgi:hypothetical protein